MNSEQATGIEACPKHGGDLSKVWMTTSKGLGISIKYGDHSRKMELRVNPHGLGVRVPQDDNLRLALLRK